MHRDRDGHTLTTTSGEAAAAYNESVEITLGFDAGAIELAQRAVDLDPTFAMAHIHLARQLQFEARIPEALAHRQRAQDLSATATSHEQSHIAVLSLAIDGNGPAAIAAIASHLSEFPRSSLIAAQAIGPFGLFAFGGYIDRHERNIQLLESVRQSFGDDWWFLSSYAFGLNELHRFSEAAPLADRAFVTKPTGNGAHTVAHVQFETGAVSEGIAFLDSFIPEYTPAAQIRSHLAWHLALFELARGDNARVNELMRDLVGPKVSAGSALSRLADGAALVWRQELLGLDPLPGAEEEIAVFAANAFARPGVTFADLHCALAYGAARDFASLDALASQLNERHAEGKIPAGRVVPALAEGIAAFAREDYSKAIAILEPVADEVVMVGGSNAQREVFEDTLLEAYIRDGRATPAIALIQRRLDRRPSLLDETRRARAAALAAAK